MTPTVWDTIAETPWWIYAIYLYLFQMAYLATKSRIVEVKALRNFALFFVISTLFLLIVGKQLTLPKTGLWLAALCIGALAGFLQFRLYKIKAVKNECILGKICRHKGNKLTPFSTGIM